MTTKIFVAIRNLEMYKCIEFHTSVPKLQGDIQCSNILYLIKALFVVPVLNCTELNKLSSLRNTLYIRIAKGTIFPVVFFIQLPLEPRLS